MSLIRKETIRKSVRLLLVLIVIGSVSAQSYKINYGAASQVGTINSTAIREASGLASSYNTPGAFWVHNDSGDGPNIYLIGSSGVLLSTGSVANASSRDWEDISSFVMNGKSYLIIGNVGDNPINKSGYWLYIIEEPEYDPQSTTGNSYPIVRTIYYQYENGSQNCESIAVDVENEKIILVSKSGSGGNRFAYELPLSVAPGSITTTAVLIGQFAMDGTTAMDISNDGQHAIVLTYDDAYEFTRYEGTTWNDAFANTPRKITMPKRAGGEAIAYGRNAVDLYLVREGSSSPVWYIKGTVAQGAVFQVDMIENTDVDQQQVWLNIVGESNPILMTDSDGDYIYTCKVDLPLNANYEYYFSYQNGTGVQQETVPNTCKNASNNRSVSIQKQNLVMKPVLFGSCDVRSNYVELQVDMNGISDIYSNGKVWVEVLEHNQSYPMQDNDDDGIYDLVLPVEKGAEIRYIFSYQNGADEEIDRKQETISGNCTNTSGYRTHSAQLEFEELLAVVFGSCEEALPEGTDITDIAGTEIRGSNDNYPWEGPTSGAGSPDGQEIDKLIDNTVNSTYLVRAIESWVEIISPKLTKVHAYTITSGGDAPTRDPRTWQFQGLNMDTEVWETLHTVTENPMWQGRNQRKSWYFENEKWHGGYRLLIQDINGNTQSLMQMSELQIFGVVGEDSPGLGSSGRFLDDCDSKTNWNPGALILNNSDVKQGVYSLEFSGSDTMEFKKVFANPYDAQGTEAGTVLQFWYYVSDVSKLEGNNQVEIGSAGQADVDEYSWSLSNLQNGWNRIQLDVKNASKRGNPDLSAINWFRLYRFKTGSVVTRIDGIQLIGENYLSVNSVEEVTSIRCYPNPVNTSLNIDLEFVRTSNLNVTFLDTAGRSILAPVTNQKFQAGSHHLHLSVASLNPGVYFVEINSEHQRTILNVVVK